MLLRGKSLVKTVRFKKFSYIGDPANTCRIFNELEVDELAFLDITASPEGREPNFDLLSEIADECFMPVSYGGGIRSVAMAERILQLGFEKVILNTGVVENAELITDITSISGSQSVVVSIDVKSDWLGRQECRCLSGKRKAPSTVVKWAKEVEERGAGEILLTSIDREGSWMGFDVELVKAVTDAVAIPVIANGGAGSVEDIGIVVKRGGASAVALGSMVVYQKKGMGVLVNFPDERTLAQALKCP